MTVTLTDPETLNLAPNFARIIMQEEMGVAHAETHAHAGKSISRHKLENQDTDRDIPPIRKAGHLAWGFWEANQGIQATSAWNEEPRIALVCVSTPVKRPSCAIVVAVLV